MSESDSYRTVGSPLFVGLDMLCIRIVVRRIEKQGKRGKKVCWV